MDIDQIMFFLERTPRGVFGLVDLSSMVEIIRLEGLCPKPKGIPRPVFSWIQILVGGRWRFLSLPPESPVFFLIQVGEYLSQSDIRLFGTFNTPQGVVKWRPTPMRLCLTFGVKTTPLDALISERLLTLKKPKQEFRRVQSSIASGRKTRAFSGIALLSGLPLPRPLGKYKPPLGRSL